MNKAREFDQSVVAELKTLLGDRVSTSHAVREHHGKDESYFPYALPDVVVFATGYGLLKDMAWARTAGIVLASLSLVAQFLFLPYSPVWSVIMMAIDVFVIWALANRQESASRA